MFTVRIKKEFNDDHITRVAGERLRLMMIKADKKNKRIEVDFTGVVIASTSFFDEGFAKLSDEGWTMEKFRSRIVLKNIDDRDKKVLFEMCKNRRMK